MTDQFVEFWPIGKPFPRWECSARQIRLTESKGGYAIIQAIRPEGSDIPFIVEGHNADALFQNICETINRFEDLVSPAKRVERARQEVIWDAQTKRICRDARRSDLWEYKDDRQPAAVTAII